MFIEDVKSSSGTFINGERLGPKALESDAYELKSDDTVVRTHSLLTLPRKFISH